MSTSCPEYDEKRLFCRLKVDAVVSYAVHGDTKTHRGQCRNLSHSGIQFETEKPLTEGTFMELIVDTKSKKFKPMIVSVEILRVEPLENEQFIVSGKIWEYR